MYVIIIRVYSGGWGARGKEGGRNREREREREGKRRKSLYLRG